MEVNTHQIWMCPFNEPLHDWQFWCNVLCRELYFSSFAENFSAGNLLHYYFPQQMFAAQCNGWKHVTHLGQFNLCVCVCALHKTTILFWTFVVSELFHRSCTTFATSPYCRSPKSSRIRTPVKEHVRKRCNCIYRITTSWSSTYRSTN